MRGFYRREGVRTRQVLTTIGFRTTVPDLTNPQFFRESGKIVRVDAGMPRRDDQGGGIGPRR